MESVLKRKLISAVIIVTMVAGTFALPVFSDGYAVDAATKKVKVKYNVNGGKFTAKKYKNKKAVTKKITNGKARNVSPKVAKAGYTLKGWYTKKKGGTKYTPNTKVNKNVTLYARWAAKKYTVKFNTNGGSAIANKKVTYNKKYGKLPTPKKDGCVFLGWYKAGSTKKVQAGTVYKTAGNTNLYARWVKFDVSYYNYIGKTKSEIETMLGSGSVLSEWHTGSSWIIYEDNNVKNQYLFIDGKCVAVLQKSGVIFPGFDHEVSISDFDKALGGAVKQGSASEFTNYYSYKIDKGYVHIGADKVDLKYIPHYYETITLIDFEKLPTDFIAWNY